MSYRVTKALVIAKDQSGRLHHYYRGSVIPWLNDEQRDHFLRRELVEQLDVADGSVVSHAVSKVESSAEKPARVAPKETWVEWAVSNGHDRVEAEALTKQDLVDLFS